MARTLVAGVDSSTQSCKVLVCDAETGEVLRQGQAAHPDGTQVHPEHWWQALQTAIAQTGGLDDVAAVSVGGQQHGMVCLDESGEVVREAQLWNDTSSAGAARDLVDELGPEAWAEAIGSVPVASITLTKLRWLAEHEPDNLARTAAVCLPHDYLTWRLTGSRDVTTLVTDRSDASGSGWFDSVGNRERRDLLRHAIGAKGDAIVVPQVLGPRDRVAVPMAGTGAVLGPGCGDNAGAALGLGLDPGQTSVSIGTSGVVAAVSSTPTHDRTGLVTGFADATGHWLPLTATINGARVLESTARLLGVDHAGLSELALAAEPGAGGLVNVCFLDGERTPNLPEATGSLLGMSLASLTRQNLARAAVEGLLCLMAFGLAAVRAQGVDIEQVTLIGGGARSEAVRRLAPAVLGLPVVVPEPMEFVARGAARQAAWVLSGADEPPTWSLPGSQVFEADDQPWLRDRWNEAVAGLYPSTVGATPKA
ncbi:xylulokinase [Aestuariimicrobium ganziense]|uniref:xylulokinase n=1 Tax=Aestuariimicrobium ganziense TaxID=2773677 RepID=UPI001944F87D|nr:FGGY family carbohydrate kinase [Aestuariimicrobium ganziense]